MKSKANHLSCIVCSSAYAPEEDGILQCPNCSLLYSGQKAGFGNPIEGMSAIAFRNYAIVADALERVISLSGAKILDVGSAEGGFTDLMLRRGANSLGLEPDRDSAKEALLKKLPMELVSFESFNGKENEYDVIVFNDVFEHMQDPSLSLEKANKMLKDGGFILINAPVSTGFIFRAVKFAARMGIKSPYQRIWAKGLCSPHIYFYSDENLTTLLKRHQFELVDKGRLIALATDGMYQRVRSTYGPAPAFVISALASLFVMISNLFPADVKYLLFRKK
jgi:2-polyprenyl-3-methyl-5-hydroxy-6-metoxy-1,4-benzoquinol methylase